MNETAPHRFWMLCDMPCSTSSQWVASALGGNAEHGMECIVRLDGKDRASAKPAFQCTT